LRTGCTIERAGRQHNDQVEEDYVAEQIDEQTQNKRVDKLQSLDHIYMS
jgi:hypothetical protein